MKSSRFQTPIILCCTVATLSSGCAKLDFSPVSLAPPEEAASITPPTPTPTPPLRTIEKTEVVAYGNKQVDFLLVLDDSNSMLPELKKLAARMSSFVSSLDASNIDWQMCMTTTRGVSKAGGGLKYGAPLKWSNYIPAQGTPAYLLRKGTANLNAIFNSTVDSLPIGGGSSGDERGIRATHDNFKDKSLHSCYRQGAAISIILISDEDERSVGGKPERLKSRDSSSAYQPLEPEDLPANLVLQARSSFGDGVRLTFNSIIVKPGDLVCEREQDKDPSPSHPGYVYAEASRLTDGGVGSICDSDYGLNLNIFKDKIVNSLASLNLECSAAPNTLEVRVDGVVVSGLKLEGKLLKFAQPLIEGTKIDLRYSCLD